MGKLCPKRLLLLFGITTCHLCKCLGQTTAVPYRPRVVDFSYESFRTHNFRPSSSEIAGSESEIERIKRFYLKLTAPIILKENLKFGLQLKFDRQNFLFDPEKDQSFSELSEHLNTENFESVALRFWLQKTLKNDAKLSFAGGIESNSDEFTIAGNAFRNFLSATYEKKLNDRRTLGGGVLVDYTSAGVRGYPMIIYKDELSPRWNLDLLLPKSAVLRYKWDEQTYVSFRTEVKGWRYNLSEPVESLDPNLTIRRTDLRFALVFEREIHDWLWAGFETGWNHNLQYFVANAGERRRDALFYLNSANAAFLKFSLFIVPPKKFYR